MPLAATSSDTASASGSQEGDGNEQQGETPGTSDADKAMCSAIQTALTAAVREANTLPKLGDQFELCTSFPIYARFMLEQRKRILAMYFIQSGGNGICLDEAQRKDRSADAIVIVPQLALKAQCTIETGANADAIANRTGFKVPIRHAKLRVPNAATGERKYLRATSQQAIATGSLRPQNAFKESIDNSHEPFVAKLRVKHHARVRKEGSLIVTDMVEERAHRVDWLNDADVSSHPYQYELDRFEPPAAQLAAGEIVEPRSLSETKLVMVDSIAALESLRDTLNSCSEFAVDLEHHDYRTFLGFICLMQISTRDVDYIVDPLKIWAHMHILNEPFTDPRILKVMHGSDSDIEWLQRDWGVYVVNLFDTGRAMRQLQFAKFGLQHLVQRYCNVVLNKQLQCADWRIRPLSEAMIEYARSDTHYLLYCYDRLRRELLEQGNEMGNLLRAVYNESRQLCLKIYSKPVFDPEGYRRLLIGRRTPPNNRQLFAFAGLWRWRDARARALDESISYVLPNHMLISIADSLPRELQGIFQCCSPTPLIVKQDAHELHRIIHAARDRPLQKRVSLPEHALSTQSSPSMGDLSARRALHLLIRTPHDFSFAKHDEEIRPMIDTVASEEGNEPRVSTTFCDGFGYLNDTPVFVIPGGDEQATSAIDGRRKEPKVDLKKLQARVEEWASPFDCYLVAMKERERREAEEAKALEERKRKASSTNAELPGADGKKRWSHRDPSTGMTEGVIEQKDEYRTPTQLAVERRTRAMAANEEGIFEEQTMTKKALKRKRKMISKARDIALNPGVGEASSSAVNEESEKDVGEIAAPVVKKRGKKTWADAGDDVLPTDYSQYSPAMFNVKSSGPPAYDPFRQAQRTERGARRGSGGRRAARGRRRDGRTAPVSISYRK